MMQYATLSEAYPNYTKKPKQETKDKPQDKSQDKQQEKIRQYHEPLFNSNEEEINKIKDKIINIQEEKELPKPALIPNNNSKLNYDNLLSYEHDNDDLNVYLDHIEKQEYKSQDTTLNNNDLINKLKEIKKYFPFVINDKTIEKVITKEPLNPKINIIENFTNMNYDIIYNILIFLVIGLIVILLCEQINKLTISKTLLKYNIDINNYR